MTRPRLFTLCVGLLLNVWSAGVAHAATGYVTTYDSVVTSPDGATNTGEFTIYLTPGKARAESAAEHTVTLFEFPTQTLWLLDATSKTATRVELAKMARQLESISSVAQEALTDALGQLGPEQRAAIDQMTGQLVGRGPAVTPSARATGERELINGYPCTVYVTAHPHMTLTEWWSVQFPPAATDSAYLEIVAQFNQFAAGLQQLGLPGLTLTGQQHPAADPRRDQFLVQAETRLVLPTSPEARTQRFTFRRCARRDDVPDVLFEIPADYQRTEMADFPVTQSGGF